MALRAARKGEIGQKSIFLFRNRDRPTIYQNDRRDPLSPTKYEIINFQPPGGAHGPSKTQIGQKPRFLFHNRDQPNTYQVGRRDPVSPKKYHYIKLQPLGGAQMSQLRDFLFCNRDLSNKYQNDRSDQSKHINAKDGP